MQKTALDLFAFPSLPRGCFLEFIRKRRKKTICFSRLTSKWVPQKHNPTHPFPPRALLSASLLHFSAHQHSCSSPGLVLSQHISVRVPFGIAGGSRGAKPVEVAEWDGATQTRVSFLNRRPQCTLHAKKKKNAPGRIAGTSEHDGKELCELGSAFLVAAGRSFPSERTRCSLSARRESGAKCLSYATSAHTALICSLAGRKANRGGSSSLDKDATRLPHGRLKSQAGCTLGAKERSGARPLSSLPALSERFLLFLTRSFISMDLLLFSAKSSSLLIPHVSVSPKNRTVSFNLHTLKVP